MRHKKAVVVVFIFCVYLFVAIAVLRAADAFALGLIFPLVVRIYFVVYILKI
jgi:hypothetical protein